MSVMRQPGGAVARERGRVLRSAELDVEEARKRYAYERDRRIDPRHAEQYQEARGRFRTDPAEAANGGGRRAPAQRDVTVAVIGGGWGGLLTAARLRQAGVEDVHVIELGGDFGGTWYWNRYPGAQCDVESYSYLPLLEETGYIPSMRFAFAPEIFEHAQRLGRHFGLYERALFHTSVVDLNWDEPAAVWRIRTSHDDVLTARFAVVATGPFNLGKLPRLPGIDSFEGVAFHTSRWDYGYTGGSHAEPLDRLGDRRVAIIGTGASAVQCVPALGAAAAQLYVLQRTPSAVGPRNNTPTDPSWAASLAPGWQRERQDSFDDVFVHGRHGVTDLVGDELTAVFAAMHPDPDAVADAAELESLVERNDLALMNAMRQRVADEVDDPELAERLMPFYGILCKRPTFNDEYLATFNRPNVELVDVSVDPIAEIVADGIVLAGGRKLTVDCIVYGTGYDLRSDNAKKVGFPIFGREGLPLARKWADGIRTFQGYAAHGFPNWFFVGTGQNGNGFNYTSIADSQAEQIAYVIAESLRRGLRTIEPSAEAEQEYQDIVRPGGRRRRSKYIDNCTPGYFNNEGDRSVGSTLYEAGVCAMRELQAADRARGDLPGFDLSSPTKRREAPPGGGASHTSRPGG